MKNDLFNDETFLARWLAQELTEAELEQFQQHPDFALYKQLAEGAQKLPKPQLKNEGVLLQKIKAKANKSSNLAPLKNTSKTKPIVSRRLIMGILGAAAAALLLFSYFNWMTPGSTTYESAIAEQKSITLPDGSSVLLNANSEIVVPANNFKNNREVRLNGEAFFSVEEGNTFSVLTDNGIVTVLGTTFSVYSRDQQASISCKSGSVSVQNNAGKSVTLKAGDRVHIINNRLGKLTKVNPDGIADWDSGVSNFESEYLSIVSQAIENQFGIKINLPDQLREERYTGSFLHQDMETALRMVFDPMNLKYRKVDEKQWEVVE